MRAVLLARATVATLGGRRSARRTAHSGGALLVVSTARAPWISRIRRYLSPRLEMLRMRTHPPVLSIGRSSLYCIRRETFQDRTSMDRILFGVFAQENQDQGVPVLFCPIHKS